jgi:hypothetical protein
MGQRPVLLPRMSHSLVSFPRGARESLAALAAIYALVSGHLRVKSMRGTGHTIVVATVCRAAALLVWSWLLAQPKIPRQARE